MATVMKERPGVLHAIYARRAVRAYSVVQPSDELIRELLDAAVQAPTAMHLEPWAFVIIQDRALLKRYSDRAKSMLLDELKSGGTLAPDGETRQRLVGMLSEPSFNIFYDAGTLVVICHKMVGAYAAADCWLAAENLMLAACDKGLGTCCIGFAISILNTPEAKEELQIPADMAAAVPMIVGFPSVAVAPIKRKPPHVLRWVK